MIPLGEIMLRVDLLKVLMKIRVGVEISGKNTWSS